MQKEKKIEKLEGNLQSSQQEWDELDNNFEKQKEEIFRLNELLEERDQEYQEKMRYALLTTLSIFFPIS